jgi:hypothetical protein
MARNSCRTGNEREPEMVANVGKLRGALPGKFAGNTVGRGCCRQIAGGQKCKENQESAHGKKESTRWIDARKELNCAALSRAEYDATLAWPRGNGPVLDRRGFAWISFLQGQS